ncbi:MAG: deoxyribonuclease IV [Victivallaceae bacterium]|nr:deoxyribonuclease IV [Victivallaceae bacterium]
MKFIGAHVSIGGGVEHAPLNAAALKATAFAMFTKNQRQWSAPPFTEEAVHAFKANCLAGGYTADMILPHDTYLINLGQPDHDKRRAAVEAFTAELGRCAELGLNRLNFHPGSHLKLLSEEEDMRLIAEGVRAAVDAVPTVTAVFENTAGQGTNLGYSFEQLAYMLEAVNRPGRVGVCIDTCHAWAAGYDLKSEEGFARVFDEFTRLIGFDLLKGMHLNDAKCELGGRLDRHESIGRGQLGEATFERIMRDKRFDGIPLVLETPDDTLWADEIARLRGYCG